MKWQIAKLAGISVYVHWTFLILLGWIAISHAQHGLAAILYGIVLILALFTIVVLHEMGHALTAQRFGIRTRDITLFPIGGVARLERIPEEPRQELLVAFAGPAVNVALAAVFFVLLAVTAGPRAVASPSIAFSQGASFLATLLWVNIVLAVFNLLPAFPMDGGRVFRALLAMRMPYARATRTAATVGQGFALVFGLVGLISNPFLVFIALFVWIAAAQEANAVETRAALGGVPVRGAMITQFRRLSPADPVGAAVDAAHSGFQRDFPIVDNGRLVGLITRSDIATALSSGDGHQPIGAVMHTDVCVVAPDDALAGALTAMHEYGCPVVAVVEGDTLVGLVTAESLGDILVHHDDAGKGAPKQPTGGRSAGLRWVA